jgi:hypothetical protein
MGGAEVVSLGRGVALPSERFKVYRAATISMLIIAAG